MPCQPMEPHIKVTEVCCGSAALKGEQFCYFHQNAHRTVRRPNQSRNTPSLRSTKTSTSARKSISPTTPSFPPKPGARSWKKKPAPKNSRNGAPNKPPSAKS